LLTSGIQQASGGFARFYDAETRNYKPVSTEISGYAASALAYLFEATGDESYLSSARKTACFLLNAWDREHRTFPFEHRSQLAWFFDCGIIIRGLLAVWRHTKKDELLDVAQAAAHGMLETFDSGADYHPAVELPRKEPLPRTDQWSRAAGCYQLKSALAWWDVAQITGDTALRDAYLNLLESALATHSAFLPGSPSRHRVMDRLHAYCYFLEGLLPMLGRPECIRAFRDGISTASHLLNEIAPVFARCDVYAQLLRARIYAADAIPLDKAAAYREAQNIETFQAIDRASDNDPRIDGGYYFGRRDGVISPHVNPVSTVFAIQALEMWRQYQAGNRNPCLRILI
jgi:hypothetical protein